VTSFGTVAAAPAGGDAGADAARRVAGVRAGFRAAGCRARRPRAYVGAKDGDYAWGDLWRESADVQAASDIAAAGRRRRCAQAEPSDFIGIGRHDRRAIKQVEGGPTRTRGSGLLALAAAAAETGSASGFERPQVAPGVVAVLGADVQHEGDEHDNLQHGNPACTPATRRPRSRGSPPAGAARTVQIVTFRPPCPWRSSCLTGIGDTLAPPGAPKFPRHCHASACCCYSPAGDRARATVIAANTTGPDDERRAVDGLRPEQDRPSAPSRFSMRR